MLSHWLEFASVPLPAAPAVILQRSCRRLPLWGYANFSGSSCLSCSCGGVLSVGFTVSLVRRLVFHLVPCSSLGPAVLSSFPCRRLPFGVYAFSVTVYLAYCCTGGLGWAATLPLCSLCFSCAGWLAGFCTLCQGAPMGVVTALWVAV